MDEELKLGDVVKLKSGGPKMTVNSEENEGEIECIWFPFEEGVNVPVKHKFKSGNA